MSDKNRATQTHLQYSGQNAQGDDQMENTLVTGSKTVHAVNHAQKEYTCAVCGGKIEKKSSFRWIAGKVDECFHNECEIPAEKLLTRAEKKALKAEAEAEAAKAKAQTAPTAA